MKRPEAPPIHFDNRTLWEAIRSAGGNVPMAARTLGVGARELLVQLASSGTRHRPSEAPKSSRDADDGPAWADED